VQLHTLQNKIRILHPARRHNHTRPELHSHQPNFITIRRKHRHNSPQAAFQIETHRPIHQLSRFDYQHEHRFTEHEHDRKTDQPEILCAPAGSVCQGVREKLLAQNWCLAVVHACSTDTSTASGHRSDQTDGQRETSLDTVNAQPQTANSA
jgi:hypothetical protein